MELVRNELNGKEYYVLDKTIYDVDGDVFFNRRYKLIPVDKMPLDGIYDKRIIIGLYEDVSICGPENYITSLGNSNLVGETKVMFEIRRT